MPDCQEPCYSTVLYCTVEYLAVAVALRRLDLALVRRSTYSTVVLALVLRIPFTGTLHIVRVPYQ